MPAEKPYPVSRTITAQINARGASALPTSPCAGTNTTPDGTRFVNAPAADWDRLVRDNIRLDNRAYCLQNLVIAEAVVIIGLMLGVSWFLLAGM